MIKKYEKKKYEKKCAICNESFTCTLDKVKVCSRKCKFIYYYKEKNIDVVVYTDLCLCGCGKNWFSVDVKHKDTKRFIRGHKEKKIKMEKIINGLKICDVCRDEITDNVFKIDQTHTKTLTTCEKCYLNIQAFKVEIENII